MFLKAYWLIVNISVIISSFAQNSTLVLTRPLIFLDNEIFNIVPLLKGKISMDTL